MTRGGNLTLIVILLILWFVGIFLAGYFGYEHFDKGKKTETNLVLFALGVVLAIGTFIGIIVLFIKRSRIPKNPMTGTGATVDSMKMEMESAPMLSGGYPGMEGKYPQQMMPSYPGVEAGYPQQMMPNYPAQNFPSANYPGYSQQMMPVAPMGYPMSNPYLAQQYSI
jgi:hypothetical protein